MSNLVDHARRELERVESDPWFIDGMLKVVAAFAPLTDDPEEWIDQTAMTATPNVSLWQNKRNSEAFSLNRGKTYYLLSENNERGLDDLIFHESEDHTKGRARV
jgi:hypothetical protein